MRCEVTKYNKRFGIVKVDAKAYVGEDLVCDCALTLAMGAHHAIQKDAEAAVEDVLKLTDGQGVDVVIDYVSATATLEAGARALGRRGRLVTLGGWMYVTSIPDKFESTAQIYIDTDTMLKDLLQGR